MTAGKTISAKITRPGLSGGVQRKRLFGVLEDLMEKPVIRVSSPAGSGKTKLISSHLDFRKFPCIGYQCDERDSDLATFFYYMGLAAKKAAPRYKKLLLLLTQQFADGISTFTRKYFEQLYSRLITRQSSRSAHHAFFFYHINAAWRALLAILRLHGEDGCSSSGQRGCRPGAFLGH